MKSRRSILFGTALPTLLTFLLAFATIGPQTNNPALPAAPAGSALGAPGFLTGPQAGDHLALALDYLSKNTGSLGITKADLADVQVTDRYVSEHNGVTHIYLAQSFNGIPVHNGLINVNVMADGRI